MKNNFKITIFFFLLVSFLIPFSFVLAWKTPVDVVSVFSSTDSSITFNHPVHANACVWYWKDDSVSAVGYSCQTSTGNLTIDLSEFDSGTYNFVGSLGAVESQFIDTGSSWYNNSYNVSWTTFETAQSGQENYYHPDIFDDVVVTVHGPDPVYGCTDSTAINYDDEATVDDDSCEYMSLSNQVLPFTGHFLDQVIAQGVTGNPLGSISSDSGGYFFDFHGLIGLLPRYPFSDPETVVTPFALYNDYLDELITITFPSPVSVSDLQNSTDYLYIGTRHTLSPLGDRDYPQLLVKGNGSVYMIDLEDFVSVDTSRYFPISVNGSTESANILKIPVSDLFADTDGLSYEIESVSIIPFSTVILYPWLYTSNIFYSTIPGSHGWTNSAKLQLFVFSPYDYPVFDDIGASAYFSAISSIGDSLSDTLAIGTGNPLDESDLSPLADGFSGILSIFANGTFPNLNTSTPVSLKFYYRNVDEYSYLKYLFVSQSDGSSFSGSIPIISGTHFTDPLSDIPFVSGVSYSCTVFLSNNVELISSEFDSDPQTFTLNTSKNFLTAYDIECEGNDLVCNLKKFFHYLIIPSQSSLDLFSPAQLDKKIPFSYIRELPQLLARLRSSPASNMAISAEIFGEDVIFFSKDMVEDWSFVSFGRNLLGAVMIFVTIWGVIRIAYLSLSDDD